MKTCLIVLTDSLYLPGTRKAIESFTRHNGLLPLIALSYDPVALRDPWLTERSDQLVPINAESYAAIAPYKKRRSKRHARTFCKFEAFADFGYDRNLFLDSDILCIRPAPRLLQPAPAPLMAARDTGFRPTRGYKGSPNEINTGVLSIGKSLMGAPTVGRLKTIASDDPGRGGYNAGDQGIINKWIRSHAISLERLPSDYNLIKKDYTDTANLESCKLLHFADRKPWFGEPNRHTPLEAIWHGNATAQPMSGTPLS